jgi:hypothetical protein
MKRKVHRKKKSFNPEEFRMGLISIGYEDAMGFPEGQLYDLKKKIVSQGKEGALHYKIFDDGYELHIDNYSEPVRHFFFDVLPYFYLRITGQW